VTLFGQGLRQHARHVLSHNQSDVVLGEALLRHRLGLNKVGVKAGKGLAEIGIIRFRI